MSDDRRRCDKGHLICQHCGACTFEHSDMQTDDGRVTTDGNGRTLHRNCRYEESEIFQ